MKKNVFKPQLLLLVVLLLSAFIANCQKEVSAEKIPNVKPGMSNETGYVISPDKTKTVSVSSKLMGFNLVFQNEPNSIWQDGKAAGYLRDVNVAFLRYPGGTVCSFYHWNAPTGEGHKDSWDPANPVTPRAPSEYMDIDEYMALAKLTGATPLVGINMSSGWRWNRKEDGVKEAIALMQYCKDKNFKVKYWFLDNEPYQKDSNGGAKTPEQYAELINTYVPAMKAFDPSIKIVVNWNAGFKNRLPEYGKLIKIAGANIDIIDVHWYWSWQTASWDKWLSKTPMEQWTGETYINDIVYFHQMTKGLGYPKIQLASFEWNVGPSKEGAYTPSQVALTQAEMMMQFIIGGLDYAILWPMHWPESSWAIKSLFDHKTLAPNPDYQVFKFLGKLQGGKLCESPVINGGKDMMSVSVLDADQKTLRVCVLNKNKSDVMTEIKLDKMAGMKFQEAQVYTVNSDGTNYALTKVDLLKSGKADAPKFLSKSISLTMLTFKK